MTGHTYQLKHEKATTVINKAVEYLVRALKSSERKLAKPMVEVSAEFIVEGSERYRLTLTRIAPSDETLVGT
jgi:hypothetical protein